MKISIRAWRLYECDAVLAELGIQDDRFRERDLMEVIGKLLSYTWVDFRVHRMVTEDCFLIDIDHCRDSFNPDNKRDMR